MGSTGVHVDLGEYLDKPQCECLNASDEHTLKHAMDPDRSLFLQSDCDEQLLVRNAVSLPPEKSRNPHVT